MSKPQDSLPKACQMRLLGPSNNIDYQVFMYQNYLLCLLSAKVRRVGNLWIEFEIFKLSLNHSLTHYRTQIVSCKQKKPITGFGFRMIWRIMQTLEGIIRTLNLHNSSYYPQSHPIIANSFGDILSLELGRRGLTVTNSFSLWQHDNLITVKDFGVLGLHKSSYNGTQLASCAHFLLGVSLTLIHLRKAADRGDSSHRVRLLRYEGSV